MTTRVEQGNPSSMVALSQSDAIRDLVCLLSDAPLRWVLKELVGRSIDKEEYINYRFFWTDWAPPRNKLREDFKDFGRSYLRLTLASVGAGVELSPDRVDLNEDVVPCRVVMLDEIRKVRNAISKKNDEFKKSEIFSKPLDLFDETEPSNSLAQTIAASIGWIDLYWEESEVAKLVPLRIDLYRVKDTFDPKAPLCLSLCPSMLTSFEFFFEGNDEGKNGWWSTLDSARDLAVKKYEELQAKDNGPRLKGTYVAKWHIARNFSERARGVGKSYEEVTSGNSGFGAFSAGLEAVLVAAHRNQKLGTVR